MNFPIPPNIIAVLDVLEAAGHEAYVVGGSVRDLCRGVTPHDYDVTTSALPEETKACFFGCRVIETGIKHGTVTVISDGDPVEITTYRTDGEYKDNRHPESVSFTDKLSADLSRRDFTVNAMAYSPKRGLYDLFGGAEHINERIISCVGEPDRRFGEDGLRILRALRFASCLDFTVEEKTAESVHKNVHLLKNISAERIYSELCRLVTGAGAERILSEYEDVITYVMPSAKADYARAVRELGRADADLYLRLSLLLRTPEGAEDLCRLKADGNAIRSVKAITALADTTIDTKTDVRRLRRRHSTEIIRTAILLKLHTDRISADESERLISLLAQTENDCVTPAALAVSGEDVMALGVPRGKAVGEMLEYLLELVITDTAKNEREALLAYVLQRVQA